MFTDLFLFFSKYLSAYLMEIMVGVFFLAIVFKILHHWTLVNEMYFSYEFEKRVHRHLDGEYNDTKHLNFHVLTKNLLDRTHFEMYELRAENKRRKLDQMMTVSDRVFMFPEASRRLIQDTLKQTTYANKQEGPNFKTISTFVFNSNPYFNRILGFFPLDTVQRFLQVLPGLFIISGIFGTFLGITSGLPALGQINPEQADAAKKVLGPFLTNMSFSMNTSLLGILLSACMTIINTIWSSNAVKHELFTAFTLSLQFLWKDSQVQVNRPRVSVIQGRKAS